MTTCVACWNMSEAMDTELNHHSSWYRRDTPCLGKNEEGWITSLVGHFVQLVTANSRNSKSNVAHYQ